MIIPSIDLDNGQAVQWIGGRRKAFDAGDPLPFARRFGRVGEVAVVDLDAALGRGDNAALIRDQLLPAARCRVGGGIRDYDRARRWLDAGASSIVIGTAATPELLRRLPAERVVVALDAHHGEVVVEGWRRGTGVGVVQRMNELRGLAGGFLVTFVEKEGALQGTAMGQVAELVAAAGDARLTIAGGITRAEEVAQLDALGADAQIGMALYLGQLPLAEAFAAPLKSDRSDGLWPTVVCDERGTALGLAWSNAQSLEVALEQGVGAYHSRRRGLWIKGESSGNRQQLLRVEADCDRDALRFLVRQQGGGFCHLPQRACFASSGGMEEVSGLVALEQQLDRRWQEWGAQTAPAQSYCARLWQDQDMLAAKLREECEELIAARSRAEVIHESADVLFFALARARAAGVRLQDVEQELNARAGRLQRRGGERKDLPAGSPPSAAAPDATARATAEVAAPPQPDRILPLSRVEDLPERRSSAADEDTLASARTTIEQVRSGGADTLRALAERWDGLHSGAALVYPQEALQRALQQIPAAQRALLQRSAGRIHAFARAQRDLQRDLVHAVAGGRSGARQVPLQRAGCYAPGGRYPLPSSVLMTACTARAAGVEEVWVASPRPQPITLAAAAVAGADALLAAGGAQAIAALAYGAGHIPSCDVVVGPGNRWVTAAKQLVAGQVAIDMPAGPTELVVLTDAGADPAQVAADLLAQAEHDPDAWPVLFSTDAAMLDRVEAQLARQLEDLPTAATARRALAKGHAVVFADPEQMARCCNRLAPEHVAVHTLEPTCLAPFLPQCGALFLGGASAEVYADYAAGPNHTLPTGGSARSYGALSVLTFQRNQVWLQLGEPGELAPDAAALARLEGLEAHARAAEIRVMGEDSRSTTLQGEGAEGVADRSAR